VVTKSSKHFPTVILCTPNFYLTDFGLAGFLAAGGCSGSASAAGAGGFLPYIQ